VGGMWSLRHRSSGCFPPLLSVLPDHLCRNDAAWLLRRRCPSPDDRAASNGGVAGLKTDCLGERNGRCRRHCDPDHDRSLAARMCLAEHDIFPAASAAVPEPPAVPGMGSIVADVARPTHFQGRAKHKTKTAVGWLLTLAIFRPKPI